MSGAFIELAPLLPDSASVGADIGLSLALATPRLPQQTYAPRASVLASVLFHALLLTTLALVAARSTLVPPSAPTSSPPQATMAKATTLPRMVFLVKPGPGGGGGGGGNRQPAPPSRAQGIGKDRITLPVAVLVVASPAPIDTPSPPQQILLDAVPLASGTTYLVGLPEGLSSLGSSQGPGVGGGVGDGVGTGIGSGTGPGMGPGSGGGFGGGAYRPGGGVTPPTLLKEVKPAYTVEALRQRIQGTVMLEVVVTREGMPGDIRVTRSLDPGLDVEAVRATMEWRFNPGRLGGTPVDVLVTIFMDFRLN